MPSDTNRRTVYAKRPSVHYDQLNDTLVYSGSRDKMYKRLQRLQRETHLLDPHSAVILARTILQELERHGISYEDFQSAQGAQKLIRRACNDLEKVS